MNKNSKKSNYADIKSCNFNIYEFKTLIIDEYNIKDLKEIYNCIKNKNLKIHIKYFNELNKTFKNDFYFEYYLSEYWDKSKNTHLLDISKNIHFDDLFHFLIWLDNETKIQSKIYNDGLDINNIVHYLNSIIQEFFTQISYKKTNKEYVFDFRSIENDFNYIKMQFINLQIFLSESLLFGLMKKNDVFKNDITYIEGFKKYYFLNNYKSSFQKNELDGHNKAFGLNIGLKNKKSFDEINQIIEKYQKDYEQFEKKKLEVDEKIKVLENEVSKNITSNNKTVEKTIQKLEYQKGKLMLSKPLEMWHKRLEIYQGGHYEKIEAKEFDFVHVKRRLWNIKSEDKLGKICWDKIWVILVSVFGLALMIGCFVVMVNVYPNEFKHTTKISIIFSIIISTMLLGFGYLLRIFVRNWISSRHIAEEINERISLTQFYLTLLQDEENNIDKEKANYALVEIFKRIDNGLLKSNLNKGLSAIDHINNYINRGK